MARVPSPVTDAVWRDLSLLARSMIQFILYSDESWLRDFLEGDIGFTIGGREVKSMTPAPYLRPGHGLPREETERKSRRGRGHDKIKCDSE